MWWFGWLGACGGGVGEANVAGCEAFLGDLACGEADHSAIYDEGFCDGFGDSTCDMAPYWKCLRDNVECDADAGTFAVDPDGVCEEAADCLP